MNIRAQAAHTLSPVLLQKKSLDAALNHQSKSMDSGDRSLYRALCYGVCRHYFSLDDVYQSFVAKPLKSKDTDIKALILLGIYQLFYLRVPDHAAINETVTGVKALRKLWAVKFVNGVLRNMVRSRAEISARLEESARSHYDHPQWLVSRVRSAWPNDWRCVLENNNVQAPMTLRVNQKRNAREQYCGELNKHDISFSLCAHALQGVSLSDSVDVESLPGFSSGECSVQDEAAQIASSLLSLATAQRVLDACCAPGGKTCHIAELVADSVDIVAIDASSERLAKVADNLDRLSLQANLISASAQDIDSWWDGQLFDRILLDVPCSATGVIRRRPDIKLLRRESDIEDLCRLQSLLLQRLWSCLAPGGIFVYATCSVLPEENEKVIAKFVESQADAIHLAIDASWGSERPFGRQLFPQKHGHDGFYYARLRKA